LHVGLALEPRLLIGPERLKPFVQPERPMAAGVGYAIVSVEARACTDVDQVPAKVG
jgi:hypothetical protein